MANRRAKFTLQLPDNLKDASENSTLVVNLQTVIAEDPEWKENVVFKTGPTLNFHSERKSWEEAERICAESGSHPASVENFDEYLSENVDETALELTDTITLLNTYVDSVQTDLNRDRIKNKLQELYVEAQTLDAL